MLNKLATTESHGVEQRKEIGGGINVKLRFIFLALNTVTLSLRKPLAFFRMAHGR